MYGVCVHARVCKHTYLRVTSEILLLNKTEPEIKHEKRQIQTQRNVFGMWRGKKAHKCIDSHFPPLNFSSNIPVNLLGETAPSTFLFSSSTSAKFLRRSSASSSTSWSCCRSSDRASLCSLHCWPPAPEPSTPAAIRLQVEKANEVVIYVELSFSVCH